MRFGCVPLVSFRVRDPSVGDVNPLQEASPLCANKIVCRCRSTVTPAAELTRGDKDDEDGGGSGALTFS